MDEFEDGDKRNLTPSPNVQNSSLVNARKLSQEGDDKNAKVKSEQKAGDFTKSVTQPNIAIVDAIKEANQGDYPTEGTQVAA